jgi:hypothetical protein
MSSKPQINITMGPLLEVFVVEEIKLASDLIQDFLVGCASTES